MKTDWEKYSHSQSGRVALVEKNYFDPLLKLKKQYHNVKILLLQVMVLHSKSQRYYQ